MAIAKVVPPTKGQAKCFEGSASDQGCKSQSLQQYNAKKYCYKIKDQGTLDKPSKFMGVDVRKIAKLCTSSPIKCSQYLDGNNMYSFQKLNALNDAEVVHTSKKVDKELFTSKSGESFELVKTSYIFEVKLRCIGEHSACGSTDNAVQYANHFIENNSELVNDSYTDTITYSV